VKLLWNGGDNLVADNTVNAETLSDIFASVFKKFPDLHAHLHSLRKVETEELRTI